MVIYNPSSATTTVSVLPKEVDTNLTIIGPSVSPVAGQAFLIEGVLTRADTSVALSGETIALSYIDVNLNSVSLGSVTTGTIEGSVKYQMTTSIPIPGDFTLKAEFAGSTREGLVLRPTSRMGGTIEVGLGLNVPLIVAGVTALSVFLMIIGLKK